MIFGLLTINIIIVYIFFTLIRKNNKYSRSEYTGESYDDDESNIYSNFVSSNNSRVRLLDSQNNSQNYSQNRSQNRSQNHSQNDISMDNIYSQANISMEQQQQNSRYRRNNPQYNYMNFNNNGNNNINPNISASSSVLNPVPYVVLVPPNHGYTIAYPTMVNNTMVNNTVVNETLSDSELPSYTEAMTTSNSINTNHEMTHSRISIAEVRAKERAKENGKKENDKSNNFDKLFEE